MASDRTAGVLFLTGGMGRRERKSVGGGAAIRTREGPARGPYRPTEVVHAARTIVHGRGGAGSGHVRF